jgi:alkaline phosphatase D
MDSNEKNGSAGRGGGAPDLERRRIVRAIGGLAAAGIVWPSFAGGRWSPRVARTSSLFTLGVASGDSTSGGANLWTRLAPDPLNGGGMGADPVEVAWELATDPDMKHVVRAGSVTALEENAHCVLVPLRGLRADSWYWYRFSALGEQSRIGRTRTFPAPGTQPERMRFALASCQNYESGYWAAYRDMAEQDLDFVLHVGDYIYEYAGNTSVPAERRHPPVETSTLLDYRNRYALYRLDPHLQDTHAAFPFMTVWDDHEVDNDYAKERREHAYRAHREHMPLTPRVRMQGDSGLNLFRRFAFGRLAAFQMLDTRQYRDDQPCGGYFPAFLDLCPELLDPDATMTGPDQEQWLYDGLRSSDATWNVLAQQVMLMKWDLGHALGIENVFNPDAWDGYQGARARLLEFLANERPANPVVLTGDIHSAWAADIEADFDVPDSPVVAHEFVCSSISSVFGDSNVPLAQATLPDNPHIKFFDGLQRGYTLCEVTPELWRADFRVVERVVDPIFTVPSPDLPVTTLVSWGVHAGVPGVVPL